MTLKKVPTKKAQLSIAMMKMGVYLSITDMRDFVIHLLIGSASSCSRLEQRAFRALSLTRNASGSNCTWSMVARIIGLEISSRRVVTVAFRADRGTAQTTSLRGR